MISKDILSKLSRKGRVVWVVVIALAFCIMSLPQTNQAQGIIPQVVNEEEPNDLNQPGQFDRIPFPVVVRGSSAGGLVPLFLSLPIDIPPIISPLTGDVVGTPRQTQIIVFLNAFIDGTDFYVIRLRRDTPNVTMTMAESGGFHDLSGDAEQLFFGFIFPPPVGPVVVPSDLDLLLFDATTGAFLGGSFNGPGFLPLASGGAGFGFFPAEAIGPMNLPRGQYLINVDDANKFTLFLAGVSPDQNILTNPLVFAWEDSSSSPYTLRVDALSLGAGQPPEDIQPVDVAKGAVRFELGYSPARRVRQAADDYYVLNVEKAGTYTFNVAIRNARTNASGHVYLLRFDEVTNRWLPVAQSTVVNESMETLSQVTLTTGRYLVAVDNLERVKPLAVNPANGKVLRYAISVFDENGQLVTMQINRNPSLNQIRQAARSFMESVGEGDDDAGK